MSDKKLRFNILDPARLIAAFAVLFYHYSIYIETTSSILPALHFGYLGVNFFFILSGFVIMASAQNRSALQFAIARALRLYPAFILCLIITLAVNFFIGGISYPISQIISNATILNDYLGIENIDGVYWTLQAELKFYGCVFLLLLTGAFRFWRYWLTIWLALAITHYFTKQPFFMGWFISPSYSFYFIGGVAAYLIYLHPKNKLALGIFFSALIFAFINAKNQTAGFISNTNQIQELVAGSVVILFFAFFFLIAKGFLNITKKPYWALVGALSYPVYLIHNQAGKKIIQYTQESWGTYTSILIAVMIILAGAYIVVRFEKIFNQWYQSFTNKSRTLENIDYSQKKNIL